MAAYKLPVGNRWRYRKLVTLPDGSKTRITGTPAQNTKAAAEYAERAHIARVLKLGATIGRPPEAGETRSIIVQTRVTEREHARYQRAADDAGMSLGEWIRNVCNIGAE